MTVEIIPAPDLALADQAEIFSRAFAGYVAGSFEMDAAALARFIFHQGADLCYSCFARTAEGLSGFAYLNRTGDVSRVAAMGVVPEARRSGVARRLLRYVIEEARARGDRAVMLEVIEQNPAARALYTREGFRETAHLLSWRLGAGRTAGESSKAPREISLAKASQLPGALEFPDLPWQISRHSIAKLTTGHAYFSGDALVVTGDPTLTPVRVHALSCPTSDAMDWGALRRALGGLLQLYPDREFFAPAVFPEQFGEEIFQPLGFSREALSQYLMRYDLPPG